MRILIAVLLTASLVFGQGKKVAWSKADFTALAQSMELYLADHPKDAKADSPSTEFSNKFGKTLNDAAASLAARGLIKDSQDLKERATGPIRFIVPALERVAGHL